MSHENELMAQIRNAVVGHDDQGRAILAIPSDAAPIDMDVPGMSLSGYGLGSPIEGCQCPYCNKRRVLRLPTYTPPSTQGDHCESPSEA